MGPYVSKPCICMRCRYRGKRNKQHLGSPCPRCGNNGMQWVIEKPKSKTRKPRRDLCMVCGCTYTEKVNSLGHETADECCDALLKKLKRVQAEHKRMKKILKHDLRVSEEARRCLAFPLPQGGAL
jgi:hypothetical protein